jgi:hypothetical protein
MDEPALWRALDAWYAGDATPAPAVRATLAAAPPAGRERALRRWLLSRALRAELTIPGAGRIAVTVAAAWLAYQGLWRASHQ